MKQSRIDFIKEAHGVACETWKARIEKEFPKIFQQEFKVGDWVVIIQRGFESVGIGILERKHPTHPDYFIHSSGDPYNSYQMRKATKEEIESHLIAEAKRRGYGEGVMVNSFVHDKKLTISDVARKSEYISGNDKLHFGVGLENKTSYVVIYQKGQWAEIIEQPPKDIQELLEKYGKEELKKYL